MDSTTLRRRKGHADSAPDQDRNVDSHSDEDNECTPLVPRQPESTSSQSNAVQRSVVADWSRLDMQDLYRYWSLLRDWLADVPAMARKCASDLHLPAFVLPSKPPPLTHEQIQALETFIEKNVAVPYDHDEHFSELMRLWRLSFPKTETIPLRQDPQWKRLGFQGTDPATDFRSAGVLSIRAMVHFAENYPSKYQTVMTRTHGLSAEESYPFACACINIVFMITDLAKLRRGGEPPSADPEAPIMRAGIARLIEHDERAFFDFFSASMIVLDEEWVRSKGTYMTFPFIIRTVRERIASTLRNPRLRSAATAAELLHVELLDE
mmetsp:Transcript_18769/g.51736  ORF Transcript_18769/g.51736 Transcript_18769/m.51736 type:complete len:322 (-) Transcript_18769:369-1334(-)|eukprot:CAMPEP_0113693418 /NCGR_PEP_ID=MMETSP0038_2-20120614/19652_1 /TAXON_ID=2898 /ORGANISM="Cryptomonas paramecium" /LENGTH=321 /DNA_ID=CAMNT_0000615485 /DNA_START=75 /DNA_END=1040 /DNA_ORIENTATION=- /assembly_acc=CAM_ASM_000170